MTRIRGVWHWQRMVSSHLPCLSRPQVATLALWSLGIVLMQSAGLTTVTACIALLLGQAEPTVRERLRSWYRPALRRCSAGSSPGGIPTTHTFPWCSMPLRWASASPS